MSAADDGVDETRTPAQYAYEVMLAMKLGGSAKVVRDVAENAISRAIAAEREAAGLDAPATAAPAFDEASEREAARVAVSRDAGDDFTRGWLARARVAATHAPAVVPESAREGLAKVLRAAEFAHDAHLLAKYPWETLTPSCRDNYIARADAAIRFLGGAS